MTFEFPFFASKPNEAPKKEVKPLNGEKWVKINPIVEQKVQKEIDSTDWENKHK